MDVFHNEKALNKRLTITDVAQALGISKTTVSRAISGKGRVGEDTRHRVLKFIEENDGNQLRWLSDGSIIPTYTIREISKLTLPVLKNVRK